MNFDKISRIGVGITLCALFVFSFVLVIPAHAQLAGANLSGVVTDESGSAVAGAKVSIKNLANGTIREVVTNTDGVYAAPNLAPAEYEVTISAKGFGTVTQKGLTLTVGAQQSLNVTMKVGQLTQEVVVSAVSIAVEATSSTISATVEQKTVVELPLNGRDWTQLATLQPGVISVRAQASTGSTANRGNRGFGDQLADSGHRPNENTYRIDGISINDYSNGAPGSVLGANLGVDAVQEFSVVTTGYTAEYGRSSGAVINAISKSGTNQFHGSGYFFDRDKILDARNFFDGPKIPSFRRTQFGGSGGGPIIKDRTWIFGDYEGVRQSQSLTFGNQLVPSDAARLGNLCSVPSPGSTCTPHSVTIDPKVLPFLKLWPTANGGLTSTGNGDTAYLNTGGLKVLNENYFTFKVDHKISDKDTLSGTYFWDKAPQTNPDSLDNTIHQVFTKRQMLGITENHVFSPQVANVFRFGFNRVIGLVNSPVSAINPAAGDTALGTITGLPAPLVEITGLTSAGGLGYLSYFGHKWNSFQAYDDVFVTKGKHSLKLGFAFERMQYDVLSKVRGNGDFRFRSLTATPNVSAFEDFLINQPATILLLDPTLRKTVGSRDSLFGGYLQDDWRVKSNLTLNLGVRYEMLTLPTEAHNGFGVIGDFYTGTTTPVNTMWKSNPTLRNFDPRIGFSWDPFKTGKTAIRGGFGTFSVLPLPYVYTIGDSLTLPFSLQTSAGSTANPLPLGSFPNNLGGINFGNSAGSRYVEQNPHRSYSMNWNLNIQRQITNNLSVMVGYVGSHVIHEAFTTDDSNQVIPTMTSIGYLWPCTPANPLPATPKSCTGGGILANPKVGFVRPIFFDGSSKYNGLQSQVRYQSSRGFQIQGSYTYGKCLSDGDGAQLGDPYLNSIASLIFFDKAHRHGPCDFDIRQNLSVNSLYSLPSPKTESAVKYLAGGWQVGGIVTASTGVPFTVLIAGDPLGQNSTDPWAYPDRIAGCNPIHGGVNYLNLNCFQLPTAPAAFAAQCSPQPSIPLGNGIVCLNRLGNAGRNQLYGPRMVNVDFSIFKNTHVPRISETFNIQFRAEFFNVFNHTNLQAPVDNNTILNGDPSLANPNGTTVGGAGVIDSTTTTSRQIQLGIKFIW
jgi:hypothetical protein